MNKVQFRQTRSIYRFLRTQRSQLLEPVSRDFRDKAPPSKAAQYLAFQPEGLRAAIAATPLPAAAAHARLPRGPKASLLASWEPALGQYRRMNLHARVAFRRALRSMG